MIKIKTDITKKADIYLEYLVSIGQAVDIGNLINQLVFEHINKKIKYLRTLDSWIELNTVIDKMDENIVDNILSEYN